MQMNLCFHGGAREGAGRKRIKSKGVAHRKREKVTRHTPLHINFKYRTAIKNKFCLRLLKRAIQNARTHGLRIIHFSLQHNHVHLIIEADNNSVLETGMRSMTVTMTKGLKLGKVQIERYHLHVLRSLRETKNAVHYVLFNQQKHEKSTSSYVDEYSSLLGLKNAIEFIKRFAQEKKISLTIRKGDIWKGDAGTSYLTRTANSPSGHRCT